LQKQLNDFRTEKETLAGKLAETGKQYDDEFTKVTKEKEKLAKDLASLQGDHGKFKDEAEKSKTSLEQEKLKLEQVLSLSPLTSPPPLLPSPSPSLSSNLSITTLDNAAT
jgi:hypothetical protein